MNIYFAGAIRGGRADARIYAELIASLRSFGRVLTEHVGDSDLLDEEASLSDREIWERDMAWLDGADHLIAEVSTPSLGVGYEIAVAQRLGKPVLCLFREEKGKDLSALIAGDPHLKIRRYSTPEEAKTHIARFLKRPGPEAGFNDHP